MQETHAGDLPRFPAGHRRGTTPVQTPAGRLRAGPLQQELSRYARRYRRTHPSNRTPERHHPKSLQRTDCRLLSHEQEIVC